MGSPLSPVIADITLQDLESRMIETLPFKMSFYIRYVDDVVLSVPSSMLQFTLDAFNSVHPRLQFTLEESIDNRLNFLDVTLIVKDNTIEFDWYHKPSFSGRYLNFESQHPLCHKKGTIMGLVDRAILLSHPRFQQKNLELVIKILLENGYPLSLIFKVLYRRLKKIFFNKRTTITNECDSNGDDNDDRKMFFSIPFIAGVSEQLKHVVRDQNVILSYTALNKLHSTIKVHKDPLQRQSRMNIVYKISCKDCDASYVGQTGRSLKTRINEHRNHITRNTSQLSVITDHRLMNHEFDWENVEILDEESILNKRLISEMLFIRHQKNSLNRQTDTEYLHHAYTLIVENLTKI
ncbi:uncharacterized protein LOC115242254 [Formica exsecta]|uniref:uncharacterized protein LOC115242254 n=1 Tax=Formica exsecta TaxID=72781 RepID=UPI001141A2DB|nr:uncharacterized protein LOC115242254 [Formica exsecta]